MKRNITLSLDEELIRQARLIAAMRDTSISGLLRDELTRLVRNNQAYVGARQAALRRLSRGIHLGGQKLPTREELHDRASLR